MVGRMKENHIRRFVHFVTQSIPIASALRSVRIQVIQNRAYSETVRRKLGCAAARHRVEQREIRNALSVITLGVNNIPCHSLNHFRGAIPSPGAASAVASVGKGDKACQVLADTPAEIFRSQRLSNFLPIVTKLFLQHLHCPHSQFILHKFVLRFLQQSFLFYHIHLSEFTNGQTKRLLS